MADHSGTPAPHNLADRPLLHCLRSIKGKSIGLRLSELTGNTRYIGSVMYAHGYMAETLELSTWRDYAIVMNPCFEEYEAVAELRDLVIWEDGDDGRKWPSPADLAAEERVKARAGHRTSHRKPRFDGRPKK